MSNKRYLRLLVKIDYNRGFLEESYGTDIYNSVQTLGYGPYLDTADFEQTIRKDILRKGYLRGVLLSQGYPNIINQSRVVPNNKNRADRDSEFIKRESLLTENITQPKNSVDIQQGEAFTDEDKKSLYLIEAELMIKIGVIEKHEQDIALGKTISLAQEKLIENIKISLIPLKERYMLLCENQKNSMTLVDRLP